AIPYTTATSSDAEYLLNVRFVTKEASDWAEAGHEVAYQQFAITSRPSLPAKPAQARTMVVTSTNPVQIQGAGFSISFNQRGELSSMEYQGTDFIYNGNGPRFNGNRWIENDAPYSGIPPTALSKLSFTPSTTTVTYDDGTASGAGAVTVSTTYTASSDSYTTTYTVYADGTIDLATTYSIRTSQSRIGLTMSLIPELEQIEYFARGPWSNFVDRKTGSQAALYKTTVTDMAEQFIRPQTMGYREDLRYMRIMAPDGFGLLIETEGQVNFSALHNNEDDMIQVSHDFDLVPREEVILDFDYYQKGLGNGSCGPGVLTQYMTTTTGTYTNRLRFTPILTEGAGYSVPGGNASDDYMQSLVSTGEMQNIDYAATRAPENLYTRITDQNVVIPHSSPATPLSATYTATDGVNASLWIDFDRDYIFSDSELVPPGAAPLQWNLSVPEGITSGTYRARLVFDTATPSAAGPIRSGRVYDFSVTVTKPATAVEYDTPGGSMHSSGQAYVKQIYTSGAYSDIEYSTSTQPATFYTLLEQKPTVIAGTPFTLSLRANNLGNTSVVRQDLRYNMAYIYLDAYGSGEFTEIAQIGEFAPKENIGANYSTVLDIDQEITIPADAGDGTARIRVIYQNAWISLLSPNAKNITEGVAYDMAGGVLGDGPG
ncbi:MAG: DUF4981 domain-containing protein, partial [Paramuribaculum sp.]|nr:DUF4981 domain-containing protein [Paramuribaculum sp.]